MAVFSREYGGDNSQRYPSSAIWGNCPWEDIKNRGIGIAVHDDFEMFPVLVTPTITTQANYGGGYKAFGSSGGTILSGGSLGGDIVFTETDDNEGIGFAMNSVPFRITGAAGTGDLWFEARLKTNDVDNTEHGFFIGLGESMTLSATVPIAAAGTLADQNFVGFHRLEGDGDQIDFVYKANGVTQVTVQADSLTTALAADTYIKLGMYFHKKSRVLTGYYNGVALTSTKTVPDPNVTTPGTDFPDDVTMGMLFAMLCASNNDAIVTMDWWRCAMLYS